MLAQFFKKLLIGNVARRELKRNYIIRKRLHNIKAIWNNTHHDDSGLEKVVRLLLAASQLFFPGIYVKNAFLRFGGVYQELITEAFVLFKVIFPLLILYCGWYDVVYVRIILVWFMAETLLYIPTLIFASDTFDSPRSYRRSMILLFLNYLEIVFSFAVFYFHGQYFNQPMLEVFDAIYFSFITSNTIGFGDYYPITRLGKQLVTLQSMFYLSFIILFINYFSNRLTNKGYFDNNK